MNDVSQHKLMMDAACGEIALLQDQITALNTAYQELVRQVEIQVFYLDAQETEPFDSSPMMLRKADIEVRKALDNVKKLLAQASESE